MQTLLVTGFQSKNISYRIDESFIKKQFDVFLPQPVDIECIPRNKMFQALDHLRRANQATGAVSVGLPFPTVKATFAYRALIRDSEGAAAHEPPFF